MCLDFGIVFLKMYTCLIKPFVVSGVEYNHKKKSATLFEPPGTILQEQSFSRGSMIIQSSKVS